jgi:hypothetical protein
MGPDLALSGRKPPVLEGDEPVAALEEVAQTIRSAFIDYQRSAEDRRTLGFDVGAANAELIGIMVEAGFDVDEATHADVHALADGFFRRTDQRP